MKYEIYDVFTHEPLAGNPLAVVHGADDLADERMQAIAKEFNLSETVFVREANDPAHSADIRIFTPGGELPFAGHPTVGTAVAIARRDGIDAVGQGIVVLGEKVGPVRCAVDLTETPFAEFDLPRVSERAADTAAPGALAHWLGIAETDIGFEAHVPGIWTGGNPFCLVPVRDPQVLAEIRIDGAAWLENAITVDGILCDPFVYCRSADPIGADLRARMFGVAHGVPEDPATGSAVAALSGALVRYDALADGKHDYIIRQGVEMGRPSRIALSLDVEAGEAIAGRIGGHAVLFAQGELNL